MSAKASSPANYRLHNQEVTQKLIRDNKIDPVTVTVLTQPDITVTGTENHIPTLHRLLSKYPLDPNIATL